MDKSDFDQVVDRSNTGCQKYDARDKYFGTSDILPMWVADMDFKTPPFIVDAIKRRASHEIYGYTVVTGNYYEAVKRWMKVRHDWDVKKEWIVFSPGVVPALTLSVMVYTWPGDKVLVQSPVYPPFFSSITDNGREVVNNELKLVDGSYEIDFDDLEKKAASGVRLMFFCSPHNPVGRVWSRQEVEKVADICRRNDIVLVSDEIHSDLIFEGCVHTPSAKTVEGIYNKTVTCMAPSKTFNIAGLAASAIIIPDEELRGVFADMVKNIHIHNGNVFGLTALEAAYNHGEEWLERLMVYIYDNYLFAEEFFSKHIKEIKVIRPESTYLLWLDCTSMGMDDAQLFDFFTREAKVGLNRGVDFGPGGEGFMRLNIGCPRSILEEGLERIKKAWESR